MIRSTLTLAVLFGSWLPVWAEQSTEQAPAVNYTDHVLPIFRQHCLTCHNANDAEAGLAIDSYGALMEGGGSGDAVVAGDASASRLYLVMTHAEEPTMPPSQERLPEESLEIIRKWIDGGLLENSGSKAKKRKGPSLSFSTTDDGEPDEIVMPESLWRMPVVTTERAAAVTALAASPWAPLVAVAGQRQVALYSSENSDLIGIVPYPDGVPQVLQFSRDGAYLLVAGGTHASLGTASLYDVRNGERLLKVGDEFDIVFGADINDQLNRVALGGPQKIVRIFDVASGEVEFELKKHTDWVYCVNYSPDGVLVASGDRAGGLHVWEADTGRLYLDLIGHQGAVRAVAWRPDSNVLLSASEDGTVRMWDMNSGNQLKSFNAHAGGTTSIMLAKDGRIATSGNDKTIKLWNTDGSALATMPAFAEPALKVAITHDGSKVVGGDWNGHTTMWLISDPKQSSELLPNPPGLEDQKVAAAARVSELEKSLEAATAEFMKRQQGVESSKQAEASLLVMLEETQVRLARTSDEMSAAEKRLAELQKQQADEDAQAKAIETRVAELDQKVKKSNSQLGKIREQLADAVAKRESAMGEKESIEQSLASIHTEQEKLKSTVATAIAAMADRELDLLARERAAANDVVKSIAELQKAEASVAELNAQVDALAKNIEAMTQPLQSTVADGKATDEAILSLTTQVEALAKKIGAKSSELASLQKQLSESQDETEQKALTERVKVQQDEIEKEKSTLAGTQAELSMANERKEAQARLLQELERKLAVARQDREGVTSKRVQALQSMSALTAQRDQLTKGVEDYSKQLATLRSEMETAQQTRLDAVQDLAVLFAKKSTLEQQRLGLEDQISRQEKARSDAQSKLTELEKLGVEAENNLTAARLALDEVEQRRSDVAGSLKTQPAVIQELAAQVKKDTESVPGLEKQLADARQQSEQSGEAMTASKAAVDQTTLLLDDARTRLEGIQSELVAFRSQAERLQTELASAQSVAMEKRSAVEPESQVAEKLTESISSRDEKLGELAAAFKKLQEEIQGLQQAQKADQTTLDQTKAKLQELEAAAEEAEAAAEVTREKVEFFQSSYGA